jgi:hypothetical protein
VAARAVFEPVIQTDVGQYCAKHIVVGLDDHGIKRSGPKKNQNRLLAATCAPVFKRTWFGQEKFRFPRFRAFNACLLKQLALFVFRVALWGIWLLQQMTVPGAITFVHFSV